MAMRKKEIRTVKRTLDVLELGFKRKALKLFEGILPEFEVPVAEAIREGNIPDDFDVPGRKRFLSLMKLYLWELYAQGMNLANDEITARQREYVARHAGEVTGEKVIPVDAERWTSQWADYFGEDYYDDLTADVVHVLRESIAEGMTAKQTMDALGEYLTGPGFNSRRLENIARTNATTAFNQGRMEMFRENQDFVRAVEYLAILDARTTEVCRARHGKIWLIDDPAIAANTPPMHYMCRSILSPVTQLEWEDMQKPGWKDPLAESDDMKTLAQKLDKKGLTPPPKGFGKMEPAGKSLPGGEENGIIREKGIDKALDVWIDDLTPCLVDRATGDVVDTEYRQVTSNEIKKIQKQSNWQFDWPLQWSQQEPNSEFYKLTVKGSREVQGLIHCIIEQGCVKAELVESAPRNIGKDGKYKGVGAHLFAIAVKRSFESKSDGYVYFESKTRLIKHYQKTLGARIISGNLMCINNAAAIELLNKYIIK